MDLNSIISGLNEKLIALNLAIEALPSLHLTETESLFLATYQPEKTFLIYGSLAPNRQNHHKITHIEGEWKTGIVRGRLVHEGWGAVLGYPGFKPTQGEDQEPIATYILYADNLIQNWAFLDTFEGTGYRRILAKVELAGGKTDVGCIYAIRD